MPTRRAYTLIELLVVILILGILATVAIPKYFTSFAAQNDRVLLISLTQVRDAIDRYSAEHDRQLPPADRDGELRDALNPYLRDGFPLVTVGPAAADEGDARSIKISDQDGAIGGEDEPQDGWHYNRRTGQFIVNYNQATSMDPNVDYDEL